MNRSYKTAIVFIIVSIVIALIGSFQINRFKVVRIHLNKADVTSKCYNCPLNSQCPKKFNAIRFMNVTIKYGV